MTTEEVDPLIDRTIAGRYRIRKRLGEGGMGQVYLAEHEAIEKKVALKILRPEYSRKEDIVTRFQQEAISASRIKHPNVLDVFDFGRLDTGEAFLAMEFLEGRDLSDELSEVKVMSAGRALPIVLQVCRALAAAHAAGVVHRDMKPDNVFLQRTPDGDEVVKIVDFGIAQLRTTEEAAQAAPTRRRLTKTGMIFGTPEYMAPEQAAGRPADLRVDIYAVGVILYELFTGAVPFTGDSFMAVLAATLNEPPPSMHTMNPALSISAELEAVISRTLAKDPGARFGSMSELQAALLATPEGQSLGRGSRADGRLSAIPMPATGTLPHGSLARHGTAVVAAAATAAPRAPSTQMGGQATTVSPPSAPSRGLVLGSIAGALALAGTAGFLVFGRGAPATPPPTSEPAAALVKEVPPPPPPPAPVVTPATTGATAEAVVAPVAAAEVKLHVETTPPGATLTKAGFQVCDATPCDITVARNEGVDLEAKKGTLRGQAKVLAQRDQTVSIALAGAAPRAKPKGDRLCEVEVDGLKIARPCAGP
ncbi:MAG: serine/threonine protein kinase [Deltaproteobacteria bacterium]|nr:serine/threonine protein kinase [Deltaproteobacteria bacterium]